MAHILIVDDDDQIRLMLRQMLEREGYSVSEASNGEECIRQFRDNPADLVITDIIMPEKEGIETIWELKQEFPDIKVIAMSGGGRLDPNSYLAVAKKFGALVTLTKPINKDKLLKTIADCL